MPAIGFLLFLRRLLLGLLFGYCVVSPQFAAHADTREPVRLATADSRLPVWPAIRAVADADQRLSLEHAYQLTQADDAISVDSPLRILGRATTPYWASFALENPETLAQERVLTVETTTQFSMRLFKRQEGAEWRELPSIRDAANGRFGGGTTHPAWLMSLPPGEVVDLLLRIEGPAIVRYPVFVVTPLSFAETLRQTHVMVGIALGMCLIVVIYIGSLRNYLDDKSVLLFVIMIAADVLASLWMSGFLSEMFPAIPEEILSQAGFAGYAVLFGCGCLHAGAYLGTASWSPRLNRFLKIFGGLWILLAPGFSLAFPASARVLLVWGGFLVALSVVTISIMATRRRIPFSGFIAVAWLSYAFFSGAFFIARLIDHPLVWAPSTLTLVQATVTAVLFGLAMSQRLLGQRDLLLAERREAQMHKEQDEAQMRQRSLAFAATAHDLRQPLVGVGLLAGLLRSAQTPREHEEYANKLGQALEEVDELLVGIQQVVAVSSGTEVSRKIVQLDAVLQPIIEEYREHSKNKRITIRHVPSSVWIETHVPYFQRIVRNLLSNAVRYTNQGDRIVLGCRRGGGVHLLIVDTGNGMSEDEASAAFGPFQRFSSSETFPEGFGLGLFSAQTLAEAVGMRISLHSVEGRGTACKVFLTPVEAPG